MKDVVMLVSGFAGGLFLGCVICMFAFFVWGLIREGFEKPKQMAIPALFLLSMFGTAVGYLFLKVIQSWPVFIGATISFFYCARSFFAKDKN